MEPPKVRCSATTKRTGKPCDAWAIHGGTVCNKHGGSAPQVKRRAQERYAEAVLNDRLGRLGRLADAEPVANPLTALSLLAGQILLVKDQLAEQVAKLDEIRYQDFKGAEQLRSEVALFERAMDRAVGVLATIAKLDIDERLARVSEQQAELCTRALLGALADAGIDDGTRRDTEAHLARRLRLVTG